MDPMEKIQPRTLSGFMELLPGPQQQMERIMQTLRQIYSRYGFTPLDTPIIEDSRVLPVSYTHLDVYKRQGHRSSDKTLYCPY